MMSKTKSLVFIAFSLLAIVLVASLASAAVLTANLVSQPTNVTSNAGSFPVVFNLVYTGSSHLTIEGLSLTVSQGTVSSTTFNPPQGFTIGDDDNSTTDTIPVTATINFPSGQTGNIAGVITADPSGSASNATVSFSVPIVPANDGNATSFTITKINDLTQSQNGELRVTNTGTTALTDITLSSSGDFNVAFSTNHFNLAAGANQLVTVSSNDLDDLDFGNNVVTITVQPQGLTAKTAQFTVVGSFCSDGQQGGNLSISSINIDNQGDGDDNSWIYLDVIEVEVKVKNKGSEKVRDVTVELGLFDADGSNQIDELDFESADAEQINLGSFSKGDTDTATFKFRIPATLDADDYKFAVKVYSDDIGESDECIDKSSSLSDNLFESVSIDTQDEEGKFIAFENIVVSPSQATCGDSVLLTTDVYNIGDNDEDQVKVILKNTEMKINEAFEITGGLDQGDKKTISFSFIVPQGLQTKTYNLELSSEYDYRSGTYRQASDESAKIPLSILGCTPSTGGTGAGQNIAAISAKLSSEAKAGEELIVTSTITNLQSSSGTFIIDASGYDSWAELTDISERVIQINAGQSKQITFTFNVNSAVEGEESFDIEIRSGETTQTKEVAVNIAAPAKTTPSFNLGENSYLWIIGIVNVVLIVLIIVVAVRISRR